MHNFLFTSLLHFFHTHLPSWSILSLNAHFSTSLLIFLHTPLPSSLLPSLHTLLPSSLHTFLPSSLLPFLHTHLPSSLLPFLNTHFPSTLLVFFHTFLTTVYREISVFLNFCEFRELWQIVKFSFAKFYNVGVSCRARAKSQIFFLQNFCELSFCEKLATRKFHDIR